MNTLLQGSQICSPSTDLVWPTMTALSVLETTTAAGGNLLLATQLHSLIQISLSCLEMSFCQSHHWRQTGPRLILIFKHPPQISALIAITHNIPIPSMGNYKEEKERQMFSIVWENALGMPRQEYKKQNNSGFLWIFVMNPHIPKRQNGNKKPQNAISIAVESRSCDRYIRITADV